jgi:hypothetical protein
MPQFTFYIPDDGGAFRRDLATLAQEWGMSESATLRALVHHAALDLLIMRAKQESTTP